MIPGKTSNSVAHGTAAGYGVYVGTGPDISMGYSGARGGMGSIFGGFGGKNPFGAAPNPLFPGRKGPAVPSIDPTNSA